VLIRALEPTEGLDAMKKNRGLGDKGDKIKPRDLCGGPSKLTKVYHNVCIILTVDIRTVGDTFCLEMPTALFAL